jgi:hypothetical protein
MNGDNLKYVRREKSRCFRKEERRGYLKDKTTELERKGIKSIRDIHTGMKEFKNGFQPRTRTIKYEKGDLLADFHIILNRWKNSLSATECTQH